MPDRFPGYLGRSANQKKDCEGIWEVIFPMEDYIEQLETFVCEESRIVCVLETKEYPGHVQLAGPKAEYQG